jgi:hypothetical protein
MVGSTLGTTQLGPEVFRPSFYVSLTPELTTSFCPLFDRTYLALLLAVVEASCLRALFM